MMKYTFITTALFLVGMSLYAQSNKKKFDLYSNACEVVFKMPRGFSEMALPGTDSTSQFAIKDSTVRFEVRYSILPYKIAFAGDKTSMDTLTFTRFNSAIRKFARGFPEGVKQITPFDNDGSLQNEFGADKGWFSHFYPTPEFGGGFTYCLAIVMRKEGVGEYYIFELFSDTGRETQVIIQDVLTSLRFKR